MAYLRSKEGKLWVLKRWSTREPYPFNRLTRCARRRRGISHLETLETLNVQANACRLLAHESLTV